jgi:hypothetical protein
VSSFATHGTETSRPNWRHTQPYGLGARAALQQVAQHIRTQSVRSLDEFASFLQWLPHPYIAKQSERRALWRRDLGRSDALIERTNMQQSIGGLVEGALAVVLRQHQHLT